MLSLLLPSVKIFREDTTIGGPVMIEANPDSVRQALLNLVDNAIKYSAVQPAIYFQHS